MSYISNVPYISGYDARPFERAAASTIKADTERESST